MARDASHGRAARPTSARPSSTTGSKRTSGARRALPLAAGLAAVILIAAAGWAAWQWPSWQAEREVRRALALGRFGEAWRAVGRWLEIRPRSAEAQYYRARVAIALGRRDDIADGLTQAKSLGCAEDRIAVLRALIDAQFGRLAQAQPVLAKALADSSEPDPMIEEALARVYLGMYDFPHARAVLSRWAKDAPDDPRPPLWRAEANRRAEAEPEVILADFLEALKRDPENLQARLGVADELEHAHQSGEAAEAYREYLALRPDDAAAHLGAGRAAMALGDEPAAVHHLDRAIELDAGSAPAQLERAKIDLLHNDAGKALDRLDRAVQMTPFDPAVHYQRSLALKRLGRPDEAAKEHATFTRLGQDRRDLEELQARLAESPDDAQIQYRLARWMFDHGYEAEGVNWSKKVLIDHPGHPDTCLLLAAYYERLGNWDQSRRYKAQAAGRRSP